MEQERSRSIAGHIQLLLRAVVASYMARPSYWVPRLQRLGESATAQVIANSYIPGSWSYSGPTYLVDVQVHITLPHTAPFGALMKCRLGQAMQLQPGSAIMVKYDRLNRQRVAFDKVIDERMDASDANGVMLPA
jgi:hypothetical protein